MTRLLAALGAIAAAGIALAFVLPSIVGAGL